MDFRGTQSAETIEAEDQDDEDRTFTLVAESSFGLQLEEEKKKKEAAAQMEEERKSFA